MYRVGDKMGNIKGIKDFYNTTAHEWANKWYSDETMLPLLQKYISLFKNKPRISIEIIGDEEESIIDLEYLLC